MGIMARVRSAWRNMFHAGAAECDLDAEIRSQLDLLIEDHVARGHPRAEAERLARIEFGGVDQVKEAVRSVRTAAWLDELVRDVRYGCRSLRRNPGFTIAAILTIALGIGVNATIFTILNGIVFRPLRLPGADRIVSISQVFDGRAINRSRRLETYWFSYPEYQAYRDGNHVLSGLLAYAPYVTATLGGAQPRLLTGALTSCNYFEVLEVPPALGRGFAPSDCAGPGTNAVVVLSDEVWRTVFGADPSLVGRYVTLNRMPFSVIGIVPRGFGPTGPVAAAFWAPLTMQAALLRNEKWLDDSNASWLAMLGRARGDVSLRTLRADLDVIAAQIDQQQPKRKTTLLIRTATMFDMPQARTALLGIGSVLLGTVTLVLLVACANVANMLLARAASRRREIAVRLALGASRSRLVRQLLTESSLMAVAGGLAGSLASLWSSAAIVRTLLGHLPAQVPPLALVVDPDLRVVAYGAALTILTAVAAGLAPALRASRSDLTMELKQECGEVGGRSRAGTLLRHWLLGWQVTVSTVLVLVTGLLLRGWYQAETIDPGFHTSDVAVASYDLTGAGYNDQAAMAFQQRLTARLSAMPGTTTALAWVTPLRGRLGGRFSTADGTQHFGDWNVVSPAYFSLLQIPIVRGRAFAATDAHQHPGVVIVSESTARRLWPGLDPIGQTLRQKGAPGAGEVHEVIGVVKDAQVSSLAHSDPTYVYFPAGPEQQSRLILMVRRAGGFPGLAADIHAAFREVDRQLVVDVRKLDDNIELWRMASRLAVSASAALGILALSLAVIGVYGVVAYTVSRRTREIGIRVALGATRREVIRTMLRQTMRPVLVGAVVGLLCTAAASRLLSSLLFGVSPYDPVAFMAVPMVLLAIAAMAGYLPARSAARVDPLIALRYE